MIYHQLGKIPPKRHTQFRRPDGELYKEHLFGAEGFHGFSSLMYHHNPPTKTFKVEPHSDITPKKWDDGMLRPHHLRTGGVEKGGDPVMGRKTLLYNNDIQMAVVRPTEDMDYFIKRPTR